MKNFFKKFKKLEIAYILFFVLYQITGLCLVIGNMIYNIISARAHGGVSLSQLERIQAMCTGVYKYTGNELERCVARYSDAVKEVGIVSSEWIVTSVTLFVTLALFLWFVLSISKRMNEAENAKNPSRISKLASKKK
jgi:hypothetical protein